MVLYTKYHTRSDNIVFHVNGESITKDWECITYLGVKLIMRRGKLVVDVVDRIKKCNASAYSVLLNTCGLTEIVRCEIIVKKCLPVLMYGVGCSDTFQDDLYKLHVAYRKVYRYIFRMSWRSHLTELLLVFGVKPINELIAEKWNNVQKNNLISRFYEICFLAKCVVYGA